MIILTFWSMTQSDQEPLFERFPTPGEAREFLRSLKLKRVFEDCGYLRTIDGRLWVEVLNCSVKEVMI